MRSLNVEPIQVLVVDDDYHLLRTLADTLRLHGYRPHTARTAHDGLAVVGRLSAPPAIALIDLRLPDMDGIELVGRLRDVCENTQAVILTGDASIDSAVRAMREQSFDYLVKPVGPQELFRTIEKASERWQHQLAVAPARESEERHRRMFEAIEDGLFMTDSTNRILEVNTAACRLTGRAPAELESRPLAELLVSVPAERASVPAERGIRHRDGTVRIVDVRTTCLMPDRLVHVVRDRSERRQLEEQLRQAQKMAAVGRVAGGIAHDFNNLLTAIRGYAALLLDECRPGTLLQEDLDEIRKAADRASTLARQLLAFNRRQVLRLKVVDLAVVIADIEKMLLRVIGDDIELGTDLQRDLGHVRADPGHIEQVIMNLVINARDAMPEGGHVALEGRNVSLDAEEARRVGYGVRPGRYVVLAVQDTGAGIETADLTRIFEPFFTTKEQGKGTGLGLSTVLGIVQRLGGALAVESCPGGSIFHVYLPRVDEPADDVSSHASAGLAAGTETILVAEDDAAVRTLVCKALTRHGYTVLDACDGDEALAIANRHAGPIHLLLTDVVMPGIGARELTAQISMPHPEVRVLYTSGYTKDAVARRGVSDAGIAFLEKPFTLDALGRKVREVLDIAAVD